MELKLNNLLNYNLWLTKSKWKIGSIFLCECILYVHECIQRRSRYKIDMLLVLKEET
jgi:hypothetical protein